MFEGKRTYILAACAGLVTTAYALNWISQGTWQVLMSLFVSGGMATLKAGQVNESAKVVQAVKVAENKELKDCK